MNKMKTPRHIEIGGISFCGSTVFNLILGSLPNVTAVGESHWLVDSINDSNEKSIQESSNEEYEEQFMHCCYCASPTLLGSGLLCEYYNRELRVELEKTPYRKWHEKIAAQLKTNIIVTSDKKPKIIKRLDSELNNDTVVLFKHPLNASNSYKKRELSDKQFRESYLETYDDFLHYYENSDKLIFLQWEDFLERPEKYLEFMCDKLDLIYDENALTPGWEILKEFHYMSNKARSFLRMDPKYKEIYNTPEHKEFLEEKNNKLLKNTYYELQEMKLKIKEVENESQ